MYYFHLRHKGNKGRGRKGKRKGQELKQLWDLWHMFTSPSHQANGEHALWEKGQGVPYNVSLPQEEFLLSEGDVLPLPGLNSWLQEGLGIGRCNPPQSEDLWQDSCMRQFVAPQTPRTWRAARGFPLSWWCGWVPSLQGFWQPGFLVRCFSSISVNLENQGWTQ